jgi:antitoxin MazE
MNVVLAKWGNSYAVRIPMKLAQELNLKEGTPLLLAREDNHLTLRTSPKDELRALLETVTAQTETAWSEPRGKEKW